MMPATGVPTTTGTPATSSATHAGASARGGASRLSATLVAAECARTNTALPAGCSVSSRRPSVSVESPAGRAGTCVFSPARAAKSSAGAARPTLHIPCHAPRAAASVVAVPVVKRIAARIVPAAAVQPVSATPVEPPVIPAPSKAAVPTDPETHSEREVWAAKPDSRIRVPSRPRHYRPSVNRPRIVRGDVNLIRVGGRNADVRVLRRHGLLRSGLKVASFLRSPAHHLDGIHNVRLLVVVCVA